MIFYQIGYVNSTKSPKLVAIKSKIVPNWLVYFSTTVGMTCVEWCLNIV